jgi:hypothetical protein
MVKAESKGRGLGSPESRRAYWQDHIKKWRRSGQSKRAYCRAQGLNLASFYRWCGKLDVGADKKPKFIPLQLPRTSARYAVEIELGNGVVVRLSNEADGDLVRGVLQGLVRQC